MINIQPGHVLAGKYKVERAIGEGGMGVVVAAQHLRLGALVAIKLLRPELVERPGQIERFLREARTAARIPSEHVVRVLDADVLDSGTPYIVMEYLEGRDLGALLRVRGPLPAGDVARYVLETCDAIHEAHALGIVHRDLKPANLFLARRPDGGERIKVLDFGISKLTGATPPGAMVTQARVMLGSPTYMSPEQIRSSRDVDARTDIWALGVILYELLTGVPPFDGATLHEMCTSVLFNEPRRPAELRAGLPEGLEAIILRCLAKDPAQRFARVAELAAALAPFALPARGEARAAAGVVGPGPRRIAPTLPMTVTAPSDPPPPVTRSVTAPSDPPPGIAPLAQAATPAGPSLSPVAGTVPAPPLGLLDSAASTRAQQQRRQHRRRISLAKGAVALAAVGGLTAAALLVALRGGRPAGEEPAGATTAPPPITLPPEDEPPVLMIPTQPLRATASSPRGALVHYDARAGDAVDGTLSVQCAPASGSMFPIGRTEVTCVATDAAGNRSEGQFPVEVAAAAPASAPKPAPAPTPAAPVPAPTPAAPAPAPAPAPETPPPPPAQTPVPAPPAPAPAADTKPPVLGLPKLPVRASATSEHGAPVRFDARASDEVDGAVPVSCTPASGSVFPLGQTQVTCTAHDAAGNLAQGQLLVEVSRRLILPRPPVTRPPEHAPPEAHEERPPRRPRGDRHAPYPGGQQYRPDRRDEHQRPEPRIRRPAHP